MPYRSMRNRNRHRKMGGMGREPIGKDPISDLLALWLLRMIQCGQALDAFIGAEGEAEDELLVLLGWSEQTDTGRALDEEDEEACLEWEKILTARIDGLEATRCEDPQQNRLLDNAASLGKRLALSELECRLLAFLTLEMAEQRPVGQFLSTLRTFLRRDISTLLAMAFQTDEKEVRKALGSRGTLVRAGLIRQQQVHGNFIAPSSGYEMIDGLADALIGDPLSVDGVLRSYFVDAPPSRHEREHFSHLATDIDCMVTLLTESAQSREPGINILLYGPPGTGKTELARLLLQEAGLHAFQVNHENLDGRPLDSRDRMRAYQLCQYLLARDSSCGIVFDEVEDVFASDILPRLRLSGRAEKKGGKAWTNQLLEHNEVPAIWITNHPEHLDRAYLRRFAYALEVRTPSPRMRTKMLGEALSGLPISTAWIDRTAHIKELTPAEIHNIARIARLMNAAEETRVEGFLNQHLRHQSRLHGWQLPGRQRLQSITFDTRYLNPSQDLEHVVHSLSSAGEGSLLLHGIPGTGKTALAKHLAGRLDRTLLTYPASQIMSKWVGETEKNLAAMFDEARSQDSVLLIDEADSLLRSREGAHATWEVTQTNELLVQIEAFPGVLILATNFMESLDAAVLRRLDFKVQLMPLTPTQRMDLFCELAHTLLDDETADLLSGDAEINTRLLAMDALTPGDYATVERAFSRANQVKAHDLIIALENEHHLKPQGRQRAVGFV